MLLHTLYSAVYSGFKYEKYYEPITSEDSTLTEGALAGGDVIKKRNVQTMVC